MNQMELLEATTVAELPNNRFAMERRYNSRSYRCALHMRAMLRRPKTVRFHWQGIGKRLPEGSESKSLYPYYDKQFGQTVTGI